MMDKIDVTVPSVARMYDYLLDGKDNYPADREATDLLLEQVPSMKILALNNRAFLRRVVRILAQDYGIKQFVDHGSGLPAMDNVHEIAGRIHRDARVVYVDNDPIVLAHGRALLQHKGNTAVLHADFRDTEAVWESTELKALIDPGQPVAALFVSVLHCIPDQDDPAGIVNRVRAKLPSGSYLVVCQLVSEDEHTRRFVSDFMAEATAGNWGRVRTEKDVRSYFEGLEILSPGLVEVSAWRADNDLAPKQPSLEWIEFGGVARIP